MSSQSLFGRSWNRESLGSTLVGWGLGTMSVRGQTEKSGAFNREVGFTPNSGRGLTPRKLTLCATFGLMHRSRPDNPATALLSFP
jgi:hypothetical protein